MTELTRFTEGGFFWVWGNTLRRHFGSASRVEGNFSRAVVGDEFEGQAGEGAFEFCFEGGLGDFEAEFLEAGSEDDVAGALERGEFAGEEVGDLRERDEARGGGEICGEVRGIR